MQSGPRNHDPAHGHGIQYGHGRKHAGTAHLNVNARETGFSLHGRKFEGHGETRRACREAQRLLGLQIILFGHGSVDFHGKILTVFAYPGRVGFHLVRSGAKSAIGRNQKAVGR